MQITKIENSTRPKIIMGQAPTSKNLPPIKIIKKPVISFGDIMYSCISDLMIRKCTNTSRLNQLINEMISNYKYSEHSLKSYISAVYENTEGIDDDALNAFDNDPDSKIISLPLSKLLALHLNGIINSSKLLICS